MKKYNILGLAFSLTSTVMLLSLSAEAQLLNRIKNEVKSQAENQAVREAGNAADDMMNTAKDKTMHAAGGERTNAAAGSEEEERTVAAATGKSRSANADYKSYDFVPGDKIIFQPDLSREPDAELPARFIIKKGNAEIQSYGGEKILHLDAGGYIIITPLMANSDYLPEQFTLEFDMMYENNKAYFDQVNDFSVQLYKAEDENYNGYGLGSFTIHSNEATTLGDHAAGRNKTSEEVAGALQTNDTWHHVALYFHKNIAKAYIGATRVSATNNFPVGAARLAIRTDGRYGYKIKNFRLAAGGDDKYKKIVTEGKFITHGILFDVNKAVIKSESMGTLNEIVKLMKDHDDLKFEIDGHTDSDGNAEGNKKLSQARADEVKAQLVKMGIEAERLVAKGFGAEKPIDSNTTAEGKANNRRVEFVKI